MGEAPNLAALVLAAGYSSRMGEFKPLLPFHRSTVIETTICSLRAAGIADITVVTGYRANDLQPRLEGMQVRCVLNSAYDQGMFSSVVTGFRFLSRQVEACFVLPGDMPVIQPNTIQMLAQDYAIHHAPITYPLCEGRRGHPPLISRVLFPEILAAAVAGGLKTLLSSHDSAAREVAVLDPGINLDLDTPEEYERLSSGWAEKRRALADDSLTRCAVGESKRS